MDEGVFQVLWLKTKLFHGKSVESNAWVKKKQELLHPPHHPILVEINAKGVDAGDEDIETKVELVSVDEKGVGYVALHNYRVFLLHFLLFLRVHFDLSRNLPHQFRNGSKKWKHLMTELPCSENLSRMLLYRTCCLGVSQCKPEIIVLIFKDKVLKPVYESLLLRTNRNMFDI